MSDASEVKKIDISSSTIFRVIVIAIGFWFLYVVADLLVLLFASIVVASAMQPVANSWERYRLPRAVSVLIIYMGVLVVFAGVVTLMIPPLTAQLTQLAHALPQLLLQLDRWDIFSVPDGESTAAALQQAILGVGDNLTQVGVDVFRRTRILFSSVFSLLFVFVIALYLVVDREALKKPFRLVVPTEHLPYVDHLIDRAQYKIGRWVLAQLFLGAIIGTVVSLGLWFIGVPYSLVLGLLAGTFEVLPVIGPIFAAVPAVIIGASHSLVMGLGVLLFYIVVQQVENQFLIPVVMRKVTGLNPLVTILAVLLGVRLGGVVGVILAVPAAVVLSAFFGDIIGADNDDLAG